jgi:hypothetical protein
MPHFRPRFQPAGAFCQGIRVRLADVLLVTFAKHEDKASPVLDADNILFQAQENANQGGKAKESKWDVLLTGRGIGGVGSFP